MSNLHIPVLAKELISSLQLKTGMVILDATIGAAGHAKKILEIIGDDGFLLGIDRDQSALKEAQRVLSQVGKNFKLFHSNYSRLDEVLKITDIKAVDGAVFDLGASSIQMDDSLRGFSIKADGPLDMRMDKEDALRAADIINDYSERELIEIFRKYSDEYFARRIVRKIIREREKEKIDSTSQLAEIVAGALPYKFRFRRIHPATKVFMALRIAVNDELRSLEEALSKLTGALNPGSRASVISFHSIEDRIVKNTFKRLSAEGLVKLVAKKPIVPDESETISNPRSRSAKLRVMEKF